ncbi:hypothetical protein [Ruminococcus sp.]|uniref:hypothetical protein n=1 Tax=Ruminococcus sp. TaxID=41978 RepID=UPI003862ED22
MSRNGKNNHYHYAEQYEKRTRRIRVRDVLRLPKKSVIFALLVLFAFGLISTTFAAYISNVYDDSTNGTGRGIVMQTRNKKAQDDTLAGVGANADLASTGATVDLYLQPADTWITSGYSFKANINYKDGGLTGWHQYDMTFCGMTMSGRPVYKYSATAGNVHDLQFQAYDGTTWKAEYKVVTNQSSGVALSNYAGTSKVYYSATECGTVDTYTLYNGTNSGATSNTKVDDFTSFSNGVYSMTKTLTGGTTYNYYLYNSKYEFGNKTFRGSYTKTSGATAGTVSGNMNAYRDASSNVFKFTPTYTGTYTITWTLNSELNSDSGAEHLIKYGSLAITSSDFYSVEIAQAADHGTVTPASKTYIQSGDSQSLVITPDNGYLINTVTKNSGTSASWTTSTSGGYSGTVTPSANTKYTVTYREVLKTVTINTNKPGTVAINSGQTMPENTNFAATKSTNLGVDTGTYVFAKPQTGFSFDSWSQVPSSSLTFSGDTTISGSTVRRVYVRGNGSDTPATLTANFTLNNPTFSAFEYSANYTFTGIPLSCTSTATSATGVNTGITYSYSLPGGTTGASVDSDGTFTATEPGTYTVTAQATDTVTVSGSTFTANSSTRTQTITVYPSPHVSVAAEPGDTSTITGTGASGDPYIFVIRQPIVAKATLLGDTEGGVTDYHRDIFTYTWSVDGENWYPDPQDPDTDEFTNEYEVTNVNVDPPHEPDQYFSTMAAVTGQSFTFYCRANLTANTDIEIIVPVTFQYNVSSEILRIDDFYFMEDKGTGTKVKSLTPHQMIYPENSAGLAADITYGGDEFNHYITYNNDLSSNYRAIYNAQATAILNQFFNSMPGHENDPGTAEDHYVNDVYLNYTSKPGVKSFKLKVEDTRAPSTLYAEAGPLNTVVGTRDLAGSKPIYFKTSSSLTNVRNIVLFYYKGEEWHFQNGQLVSAGYYRFNVPSDVTGVFFGAAKSGIYGLPTMLSNGDTGSIAFSATDYVAWSGSQVSLSTGNPKYTGVISGTSITGSFGPM